MSTPITWCFMRPDPSIRSPAVSLKSIIFPMLKTELSRDYDRSNGQFGTRNFIAVLTSVNCSATAARNIADHFTADSLADFSNVDGVVTGCAMDTNGDGYANL